MVLPSFEKSQNVVSCSGKIKEELASSTTEGDPKLCGNGPQRSQKHKNLQKGRSCAYNVWKSLKKYFL